MPPGSSSKWSSSRACSRRLEILVDIEISSSEILRRSLSSFRREPKDVTRISPRVIAQVNHMSSQGRAEVSKDVERNGAARLCGKPETRETLLPFPFEVQ